MNAFSSRPQALRGSRGFVIIGAAAVVLAGSLAVAFGSPEHSKLLSLLSGHGWLTTSRPGQVVLANGQTGQLDFRLNVGTTGDPLDVVQSGQNALLVDEKTGEAGSIDVGDLKVVNQHHVASQSLGTAGDATAANQVLPGPGGTFYVVHRQSGRIDVSDPVSGQTVATKEVGSGLSPAVVDGSDTLWTERQQTGAMVGADYQGGQIQVNQVDSSVVAPGDDVRLSSVNGTPAVLDQSRGLFFLAPRGVPGTAVSLPRTAARQAVVAPTVRGPVVPLATTGKVILIQDGATNVVDLNGRAGDQLGAPVPFAQKIYVPDLSDGAVVVLNDSGEQVGTPIQVAHGSAPLTVDVQNGALFINDLDSGTAYSVTSGGQVNPIAKNDPDVPTNQKTPTTVPPQVATPPVTIPTPVTPTPGAGPGSGGAGPGSNAPATTTTTTKTTTTTTTTTAPTVPASVPAAPGSPTAQAGSKSVTVSWTPPDTHGSPITGYTVTWTAGGGGKKSVGAKKTSVQVTGLKNGTSYTFSIKAANAIGTGPAVKTTAVTPTNAVPDAPTDVTATAGKDGSIKVTWTPATGEGHTITSYTVTATPTSGTALAPVTVTSGTATTFTTAQGLVLGTSYTFTVTATNDAGGSSQPSSPSKAVTAHTLPSPVSGLAMTPGDGTVTLSWVCDPDDAACSGGTPVTKFDVSVTPTPGTPPSAVSAVTGTSDYSEPVDGLTNGTGYTFTVAACNALGCTTTKTTASVVPFGAPGTPSVTGSVSGTTINWSWNTPTGNGRPITSFTVSVSGSVVSTGSLATSYSGTYTYAHTKTLSVVAVNAGGLSSPAGTNSQRTVTPPPPPKVTISEGAAVPTTSSVCTGSSTCHWINVSLANFPASSPITFSCYDAKIGKFYTNSTWYTTNGSGAASWNPSGSSAYGCADSSGYPTIYVAITVNGVHADSNKISW